MSSSRVVHTSLKLNVLSFFVGKWHTLDFYHVPHRFFYKFLHDLGNPTPTIVKYIAHWRAPMMSTNIFGEYYKFFEEDSFQCVFASCSREIKMDVAWGGDVLVEENAMDISEDPIAAISAAKRRAKDKHTANITCRSSIVLGRGEGRATRELEVKWFPHIYRKDLECGKLCLRFYVAKFRFG